MTLFVLLCMILISVAVRCSAEILNLKQIDPHIPETFVGLYSPEKYAQSQHYLRDHTQMRLVKTLVFTSGLLCMLGMDFFETLDHEVRILTPHFLSQGLLYIGILGAIGWIASLPFQIYGTFVVEARYHFNTTTPATFLWDQLKAITLSLTLGGIVLTIILWFFTALGNMAWGLSWIAVTAFELFVTFIAPVVILPLFNKLVPLPEGDLKSEIETYAKTQHFQLRGIFTMDGSKRSTKGNAFFTGFGKFRRIVFFDTLLTKHTTSELLSILAHEVGHFKKHHVLKHLLYSVIISGMMFYALSWILKTPKIFSDLGITQISTHVGLVIFGLGYTPVSQVLSLIGHTLSRRHEFEADAFSQHTYSHPGVLASALKKLSVDHLNNLKPHPLKVWLDYTHPPILQRLERL